MEKGRGHLCPYEVGGGESNPCLQLEPSQWWMPDILQDQADSAFLFLQEKLKAQVVFPVLRGQSKTHYIKTLLNFSEVLSKKPRKSIRNCANSWSSSP